MNKFPEYFNADCDVNKLKQEYYMNDLRSRVYKHIITNGEKSNFKFFNLTKEDVEYECNITSLCEELTLKGFKYKLLFGGTSLLIYNQSQLEFAKIWLNEELSEL